MIDFIYRFVIVFLMLFIIYMISKIGGDNE